MWLTHCIWSDMRQKLEEGATLQGWWNFSSHIWSGGESDIKFGEKEGEGEYDDNERCGLFESGTLHAWEGVLQGLSGCWVFPKVAISGSVIIWHIGLQRQRVPSLKLFHTCYFNNLTRGSERFRDMDFSELHKDIRKIKGTWMEYRRWNDQNLEEVYNSVKYVLDFDTVYNRREKYKWFEQQSWETVYWGGGQRPTSQSFRYYEKCQWE